MKSVEKISDILQYDNEFPVEFVIKQNVLITEDTEYIPKPNEAGIPRFSLKGLGGVEDIEINKPMEATEKLIITAIKYGMLMSVQYKGEKDEHAAGHQRVLEFMVIGRSSVGKILIRCYHLRGWSFSSNSGEIEKIWRMFRLDRIKSVTFTGSFYRLPPAGYVSEDKGFRGGIIARADFNEIRKNQQTLLKSSDIQNRTDIEIDSKEKNETTQILLKPTDTKLDLMNPFDNPYIESEKNSSLLRISFLKSLFGNTYIAVIGAMGRPGGLTKVRYGNGKTLGTFKIMDSIDGKVLKNIKKVKGNTIFELYIFVRKLKNGSK